MMVENLVFWFAVFTVFAIGALVGSVAILLWHRRLRKMRETMRDYAETYRIIEDNKRLKSLNEELAATVTTQQNEINRYRRALVQYAEMQSKLKNCVALIDELRAQIDMQSKAADQRFGRLIRILAEKGVKLTQQELNDLTP